MPEWNTVMVTILTKSGVMVKRIGVCSDYNLANVCAMTELH